MKEIPVSRGYHALVDDEDYEQLIQRKWSYCCGYAVARWNMKMIKMHRMILGAKPGEQIDHVNLNKLDNRRGNLRMASVYDQARHHPRMKTNKTGFKGIYWRKSRSCWVAVIKVAGRRMYLGHFQDKIEAARAYDLGAILHFGEFAVTNF